MRARLVAAALVLAPLSVWGCRGHTTPNCSSTTVGVALPDAGDLTSATFSTNPECGARAGSTDYVDVSRFTAGTCQVQVVVANGDTYAFSVEFGSSGTGYCEHAIRPLDASSPVLVDAGPCHPTDGGAAGTTGDAGTGGTAGADGGTVFSPACADLTTAAGVAPIRACGCTTTDPQLCYKPCGPEDRGARPQTCTGGVYVEMPVCHYDPAQDYACYKVPTIRANPTCPLDPPQEGAACTVDRCVVCNYGGGLVGGDYIDRHGFGQIGYCVCPALDAAGNRSWSCAKDVEWPCPGASGC